MPWPRPHGLHQQQPQPGGPGRAVLPYAHHRADGGPVELGDPDALQMGVVVLGEVRDDPGDQALELLVPAELGGVERAVPLHDPAQLAGLRIPQADPRGRGVSRGLHGPRG